MKKSKTKPSPTQEETLVIFLLDRTGSMSSVKHETITGFNAYIKELRKKPECKNARFSFSQFDSQSIDEICRMKPLHEVELLNNDTFQPRDMTPLYDAIGKTIRANEKDAEGKKVIFTTLTDGQENASHEWNDKTIKAFIKEKEEKDHWTFAYVGIGPDAWEATMRVAAGTIGASNVMRSTHGNTAKAYNQMVGTVSMRCSMAGGQSLSSVYGGKQLDEDEDSGNNPA